MRSEHVASTFVSDKLVLSYITIYILHVFFSYPDNPVSALTGSSSNRLLSMFDFSFYLMCSGENHS